MKLASRWVRPLEIPFRVSFKHSSAERTVTSALLARAETVDGKIGLGEGCPRPYVTGETLATSLDFFVRHQASLLSDIHAVDDLIAWVAQHEAEIDANPAAWCALELALLEALAKDAGQSVEAILGLENLERSGRFAYTAVLGDSDANTFSAQVERYAGLGFTDFKIKIGGDPGVDGARMAAVLGAVKAAGTAPATEGGSGTRIRLDANNLWETPGAALEYLDALPVRPFAVEEPLRPLDFAGLKTLAAGAALPLILDESFLNSAHFEGASTISEKHSGRAIINLRVSKMGGLIRSLAIVKEAAARGIPLIVGAQVGETSILTRAALTVASAVLARRGTLLAQEGAFGTLLLESDVTEQPLMFGKAGWLDAGSLLNAGLHGFGINYRAMVRDWDTDSTDPLRL